MGSVRSVGTTIGRRSTSGGFLGFRESLDASWVSVTDDEVFQPVPDFARIERGGRTVKREVTPGSLTDYEKKRPGQKRALPLSRATGDA